MTIKVIDQSVTRSTRDDEVGIYVHGGVVQYELDLRCAHEDIELDEDGYYCPACENIEITEADKQEIMFWWGVNYQPGVREQEFPDMD